MKKPLSSPLSALRQWARSHEKILVVGGSWTLAAVFIVISVLSLLKSLGIL